MRFYKLNISLLLLVYVLGSQWCSVFAEPKNDYQIGAEDVLHISVWQEDDLERVVTVSPAGIIDFPLIGQVKAAGMTAAQLADRITSLLKEDYLVNPQVTVSIQEYRSQKVYVLGQVVRPGLYYLRSKTTLLEMISQIGGITEHAGKNVLIIRSAIDEIKEGKKLDEILKRGEAEEIDLYALLVEGDMSYNRFLQPEDVIFIPSSKDMATDYAVYVMGAIKRPGAYEYKKGLTALNACIIAGGFTEVAAPNRCEISRLYGKGNERQIVPINLEKVKAGKLTDIQLKPGDRIFVPESYF
jgi:polysaccharide export outer membrane protein